MNKKLFPGGLRAVDFLFKELTATNTDGLSNSNLTAQVPLSPAGILPDDLDASQFDPNKPFPALHGWPGEDTGMLPGTQNIVMRFTKGSASIAPDGFHTALGQSVIVSAVDVYNAFVAGGIDAVQKLIDTAQYAGESV